MTKPSKSVQFNSFIFPSYEIIIITYVSIYVYLFTAHNEQVLDEFCVFCKIIVNNKTFSLQRK